MRLDKIREAGRGGRKADEANKQAFRKAVRLTGRASRLSGLVTARFLPWPW